MASPDINYQSLNEENPFHNATNNDTNVQGDHEDTPRNSGIMIHVVPETSRARWNHIEDLDSFFTRMYSYHQKHGFVVIVLDEIFKLLEFGFVVWLLTFTIHCVKHSVLFGNEKPDGKKDGNYTKVTLNDVIIPTGECVNNFGAFTYLVLFLCALYFMIRFIKMIYHITQYSDIKKFYNSALNIADSDLDNTTWHDVKKNVREVQAEQHMCIDKEQLTELDIYHRILRFKNYMVALMNKGLLPVKFKLPIFGEVVSLSRGMLFNIDFILFRGPGSPFQNNWQLREDYSMRSNTGELAQRLSKLIMWVAIANLILSPIIFLWQIVYFSFAYANILRKEPNALGMRTWSNYGRLYLRHFNELDHELDARLNRAYQYADRYLSSFSSPVMAVVAKNLLFISGGILVLILSLGIYDEFVFQVEHVLTIITILTVIGIVCRSLIPDENLIWCPEQLMTAILAHAHYLPTHWKGQAHTATVQKEFSHFFQFKASYLLNEICSPLITPFVLLFVFKPKTLEIVKFFRSFTVTVRGVGNVCSFAQMDVRKHGNPEWQLHNSLSVESNPDEADEESKAFYPVENGKTELSLVRFTLTNPEWQMPKEAQNFITEIRKNALADLIKTKHKNYESVPYPITESLISFGTIGNEFSSIATSVFKVHNIPHNDLESLSYQQIPKQSDKARAGASLQQESEFDQMLQQNLGDLSHDETAARMRGPPTESMRKLRVWKAEGSLNGPSQSLINSITGPESHITQNTADLTVADMCLSALYLHEVHKQNVKFKASSVEMTSMPGPSRPDRDMIHSKAAENTPLLGNLRS